MPESLLAWCRLPDRELAAIREALEKEARIDRTCEVELTAGDGTVHARLERTIHVRRSRPSGSIPPAGEDG